MLKYCYVVGIIAAGLTRLQDMLFIKPVSKRYGRFSSLEEIYRLRGVIFEIRFEIHFPLVSYLDDGHGRVNVTLQMSGRRIWSEHKSDNLRLYNTIRSISCGSARGECWAQDLQTIRNK